MNSELLWIHPTCSVFYCANSDETSGHLKHAKLARIWVPKWNWFEVSQCWQDLMACTVEKQSPSCRLPLTWIPRSQNPASISHCIMNINDNFAIASWPEDSFSGGRGCDLSHSIFLISVSNSSNKICPVFCHWETPQSPACSRTQRSLD